MRTSVGYVLIVAGLCRGGKICVTVWRMEALYGERGKYALLGDNTVKDKMRKGSEHGTSINN